MSDTQPLRDTPYANELCKPGSVKQGDSECRIERIRVKESDQVEIRFSWWKNGNLIPRPLDLPEEELLQLFKDAIDNGVFSETFKSKLREIL